MKDETQQRRLQQVAEWHAGAGPYLELHDYLGMDYDEYCVWIDDALESVDT